MSEHTSQGIFDMDYETYRAAQGVSCSDLNIIAEHTPAHLRYRLDHPDEETGTEAKEFGTQLHYRVLQTDLYREKFHFRPEKMNFTTKDGRAWKEEHSDKPVISFLDATKIEGMAKSLQADPYVKRLFTACKVEQSIFAIDSYGTVRKARPDMLAITGNALSDIKTCRSTHLSAIEKAIANYRYHVKAAYYLDICNIVGLDKHVFFLIFVEDTPPYTVRVARIDGVVLEAGKREYQANIQVYRNCLESGIWPSWDDAQGYIDAGLPKWAMKEIEALI